MLAECSDSCLRCDQGKQLELVRMRATPKAQSITEWVGKTVTSHGDLVAVSGVGESLTYKEMWHRSAALAQELVARGIESEDRVGLWAEQSSDLLVGMIGIMRAGAAYVPLDPSYPTDRLRFIASDANLTMMVVPDHRIPEASFLELEIIATGTTKTDLAAGPSLPRIRSDNAAYVIYTSGSTGQPKGVVIEHHSVVDLLEWMTKDCELEPRDRLMGTSSAAFDASVPNVFLPLISGGEYVALASDVVRDPRALAAAVAQYRPRVLQASPTMLRMLTETAWTGDADVIVITGGERTAASAIRHITPRVRAFFNYYGPTETTVNVTMARLRPDDTDSPVGSPPDYIETVLLDSKGQPPQGEGAGELFIVGSALARGYLNDPVLTKEHFPVLGEGTDRARRAYRTGDLARYRTDGSLLILGRIDDQIKIRGYRIEPSEIESCLMTHPQIIDAVVVARQVNDWDDAQLEAFVKSTSEINTDTLRTLVRDALPEYMVPNSYFRVEDFPLTPSGKVDKNQLGQLSLPRTMETSPANSTLGDQEATDLEISLLGLFASVLDLNVENLRIDDDFFDLGGTSLRCMRLFMMIEERYEVAMPLTTLIASPTARLLSKVISDQTSPDTSRATVGDTSNDEWEWVLCILWSEILKVSDVERTDDFFGLGGTTDDAERMIRQLKIINGTSATVGELRRAPTISQFATLTQGRSTRSSVVPINGAGSRTPFFCVAGPGGLALGFLPLSRLLGAEQPFYGLQAHGLERRGLPDFSLGQSARRYAKAIQEVQPHGPYLLGGHSLGGAVALKVAQHLTAQGESVALLALFDSILPNRLSGLRDVPSGEETGRAKPRRRLGLPARVSRLVRLPLVGLVRQKGTVQFEMFGLHGSLQAWHGKRLESWPGFTVLYISKGDHAREIEAAWENLLTGPWACVTASGGHWGLLQRPYVVPLAKHLETQMTQALAPSASDKPNQENRHSRPGKRSYALESFT